ncbi:MAG: tail fiber domain-containing protein [Oscillospiraceae bacterium]|nr:tail fiber domain-containing protein [Oscillospiraceae bacterium]
MGKVFVGRRCASISRPLPLRPVSKVVMWIDNDNCIEVGDETGRTVELYCPYGTDSIAQYALSSLRGYDYRPFEAEDALVDPAAELGDGITVGGMYSFIGVLDFTFDRLLSSDVSAPGGAEIAPEFHPQSTEELIKRDIVRTGSSFTKTASEIRSEVKDATDGLSSSIAQTAKDIRTELYDEKTGKFTKLSATVNGLSLDINGENGKFAKLSSTVSGLSLDINGENGKFTKLQTTVNGLSVDINGDDGKFSKLQATAGKIDWLVKSGTNASNFTLTDRVISLAAENIDLTGFVTFKGLSDGTTTIDGACIKTGTLDSTGNVLGLKGLLKLIDPSNYTYGYIGSGRGLSNGSLTYGPAIFNEVSSGGFFTSNYGAKIFYDSNEIFCAGSGCFSSSEMKVGSDRRLKNSISYDFDKEEKMFALLKPCSFAYNLDSKGKRRWGFIAQELVESAEQAGMDVDALDVVTKAENGLYAIAYGEMVALNTHMIQKLMERVSELEKS